MADGLDQRIYLKRQIRCLWSENAGWRIGGFGSYRIFFAMCRKFSVSWSKASEEQKAFIEEITRINYEREMAKRNMTVKPVRGFFDAEVSA